MISTKFALLWNLRWATGGTVSTSTGGPPVATAKSAYATAVFHRWGFVGTSVSSIRIPNTGQSNHQNQIFFQKKIVKFGVFSLLEILKKIDRSNHQN